MVKNTECLIVNLAGGPGCGKSTAAAYISYYLKKSGVNCELATEFAKGKTWEMNMKALACQPYLFGEQCWKIDRCVSDVSVIVTDSPLFLSAVYNPDSKIEPEFSKMVFKKFNTYNNLCFLLKRQWDYQNFGRKESEEQAIEIDAKVQQVLKENCIAFEEVPSDEEGYNYIIRKILEAVNLS